MYLIMILSVWVGCGAIGVMMGSWAGEGVGELLLRIALGPISIIIALAIRIQCPHCARRIHRQSSICPHCERQI